MHFCWLHTAPFATGENQMDLSRNNRLLASFDIIYNISHIIIHL